MTGKQSFQYDVIVIGGGIAGLGIAAELVGRKILPLVVERNAVGGATSDNTLRIIHGGFRYLQRFNLPRVKQSLRDQDRVWREMRHACRQLPCVLPLRRSGLQSRTPVEMACLLFAVLSRLWGSRIPFPRVLPPSAIDERIPGIVGEAPHSALLWYDVLMDNPRLVISQLSETVSAGGGSIREQTPVSSLARQGEGFSVTLASGETLTARSVVNAAGPWIESIVRAADLILFRPKWCKGFNLVASRKIDPIHAVAGRSKGGRQLFCVPRESGCAMGTWYLPVDRVTERPSVTTEEIRAFLEAANEAFPSFTLHAADVSSTDVGVLPMKALSNGEPLLYGREQIASQEGYFELLSTKYTTFFSQGARMADGVQKFLRGSGSAAITSL